MPFAPVTILRRRGPVSQEEPTDAPAGLEVDFDTCLSVSRDETRADPSVGCDLVYRYPARINGQPAILTRRRWVPAEGYCAEGDEDSVEVLPVYLVAAPASWALPSGVIDARAGFPAYPESDPDARERIGQHIALSDEPLTVYRCVRDASWWSVLATEEKPKPTLGRPPSAETLLLRSVPCDLHGDAPCPQRRACKNRRERAGLAPLPPKRMGTREARRIAAGIASSWLESTLAADPAILVNGVDVGQESRTGQAVCDALREIIDGLEARARK